MENTTSSITEEIKNELSPVHAARCKLLVEEIEKLKKNAQLVDFTEAINKVIIYSAMDCDLERFAAIKGELQMLLTLKNHLAALDKIYKA